MDEIADFHSRPMIVRSLENISDTNSLMSYKTTKSKHNAGKKKEPLILDKVATYLERVRK